MGSVMGSNLNMNESDCKEVFENACCSGDTTRLHKLIIDNKFNVSEDVNWDSTNFPQSPLVIAIKRRSIPVVSLLLKYGAKVDYKEGDILDRIITHGPIGILWLLSDRTSRVSVIKKKVNEQVQMFLYDGSSYQIERRINTFETELGELIQLVDSLEFDVDTDKSMQALGKYARLCRAVIKRDGEQVSQLLKNQGNYFSYASVIRRGQFEFVKPSYMGIHFGGLKVVKAFLLANIDTVPIYFNAARDGNIEILDLCVSMPGFNPHVRNDCGETALHVIFNNVGEWASEVFELLVKRYGLDPGAKDTNARTLLFNVSNAEFAKYLLKNFPQINVNQKDSFNQTALEQYIYKCDMVVTFLEFGAEPECAESELRHKHDCRSGYHKCLVIRYLRKMWLLDEQSVRSKIRWLLGISVDKFKSLKIPKVAKYEEEISRMKAQTLSRSTSYAPGKSLYDFIFMSANEAARYSKNEQVLRIYKENRKDFRHAYPQYGHILNDRFHKGAIRRERLELALEFLNSSLGKDLPELLGEMIFENFSNERLKRFSPDRSVQIYVH